MKLKRAVFKSQLYFYVKPFTKKINWKDVFLKTILLRFAAEV